ncbi:class II glutamine amidotransferase [uncultured Ruegeria sp.]|uniref:class II glutamine amidotransferase n=1 Tax=uncultured Ruegeria sp. TaxID=259304 RepID=UPI0026296F9F|nr:class II glutamine amidotransferase [uncultured Ruegeria sp.]
MCRIVAYSGPSIPLENIIIKPRHSLLEQSQHANEAKLAVNGDGFGMAWYAKQERPGLYRDVLPAWSDGNLDDLCRMIKSPLFLAHVRASTFGEVSRSNCHPFTFGKWSFVHNGQIGEFGHLKRGLETSLTDEFYAARRGSTDSELLFLLMLANGLDTSVAEAIQTTLRQILALGADRKEPDRMAVAISDGTTLYAFRYSTDQRSPSLYIGEGLDHGGRVIASEPLDKGVGTWTSIEEFGFFTLKGNVARHTSLTLN